MRGHHPAVPFDQVPACVADLRGREAVAALALEFLILTAARTSEVIGARWSEIARVGRAWIVPAARIKNRKEHRVPLVDGALAILDEAEKLKGEGGSSSPARSRGGACPAWRWTSVAPDEADGDGSWLPQLVPGLHKQALSHTVGDETERAYRRADALERRRKLMAAWAGYLDRPKSDKVVPIG